MSHKPLLTTPPFFVSLSISLTFFPTPPLTAHLGEILSLPPLNYGVGR